MILVGRVANLEVNNEGKAILMLAIPRSFKNADGEYETDILKCRLYGAIATNTKEYCKKGDIVGVKGRVESKVYEKDDEKKYITEIIAEKVTFLSSNKTEAEEA